MKRLSPESSMSFKINVLYFQKIRNQKNLSKKNQDAINFLKPAKPTSIWNFPTISIWSDPNLSMETRYSRPFRRYPRRPYSCTSIQMIMRILSTISFSYLDAFTPFTCKESLHQFMAKEQWPYFSSKPCRDISGRLLDRGYTQKLIRYKGSTSFFLAQEQIKPKGYIPWNHQSFDFLFFLFRVYFFPFIIL